MALPLDYSSSEGEEIPNGNHGNGTAEYSQISDYELISADDRLQASPNNSHGNGQAAQGFHPINSQEGEGLNPQTGSSSTTVVYNGMEIHVFGNVGGFADLQVGNSSVNENDSDGPEKDEEAEEEERRREEAEIAIREANMADLERRRAPLNPERRAAIINAMRGITLEGFRPDWADTVPENQWVDILRRPRESPSQR